MWIAAAAKSQYKRPDYSILKGMNPPRRYRWLWALALMHCLPGVAATVYKSVDENGVVSYSDTLPQDDTLLETVVIDNREEPPNEQSQKNLKNMRETTDRMATDRMAREKHRAEMRELQAQTEAMQPPQYSDDYYGGSTTYSGYTSGYGYYNYPSRRYGRRPGHGRPVHPIARPPLRHRPVNRPSADNFPAPHIRPLFTPRTRGAPR
jgi:hypothetical protein